MIKTIGLINGKEKSWTVFIPQIVTKNWNIVKHTIRGIVDTDGSIFVAKKPRVLAYPSIEFDTSSKKLALQLREILLNQGFRVANIWTYQTKLGKRPMYKVPLNGIKNLEKWLDEIGFSNPYKLRRAQKCLYNYQNKKNGSREI